MGQFTADEEMNVAPTIVGGQPPPNRRRATVDVPVGMERVIYAAAVDPAFCEALLRDREAAVRERGFTLRDSELAMLRAVPEAHLRAAVESVDPSAQNLERRSFLRVVAAGAITLAAGDTGCGGADTGTRPGGDAGVRPDTAGIRPDAVPVDAPPPQPAGIRPG
jgi:hypothetical protein